MKKSSLSLIVAATVGALALPLAAAAAAGPGDAPMPMGPPPLDFKAIDKNGDGKITPDEMKAWHEARLKSADTNGDGAVSVDELKAEILKRMEARADDMAKRMMERKDANGDGKLSPDEMMPANFDEVMFARLDANGDGVVTQDEVDAARARMEERMKAHGERDGHHGHGGKHRGWFDGGDEGDAPPQDAPDGN